MSNAMIPFALRENDLELVVSEKTLGSLTTNALQIKQMVEQALPMYDVSNYDDHNIDAAKRDKAMLNNASKALNAKRIEFEKEFVRPFAEFKAVVADTVDLIKTASGKIDEVVKRQEEREREAKREQVQALWDKVGFTLVPLAQVFRATWLNKTMTPKTISAEIGEIVAKIESDILTIEAIGEDVDLLKGLYLDTLDLNRTIQHARTLKDNRERAKADAARREAEAAQKAAEPLPVSVPETIKASAPAQPVAAFAPPALMTRAFKVTSTRENIIALGDFMNAHGIAFEKIDLA